MAGVQSVHAATITVTNTNDSGPGSLRQALADANDGYTIDFSVSGRIFLTSGQLVVDTNITISGPGANRLAVDGNHNSRVFYISPDKTVTISGLTITNGNAGIHNGGGIYNDHAFLTVSDCTVSGNSTATEFFFDGGGIYNNGFSSGSATLLISNSTVSDNSAESGGISGGDTINLNDSSSVNWNTAATNGGGIEIRHATLNLNGSSSVNHNNASDDGGGIYFLDSTSTVNLNNTSAVNHNSAAQGGGIYNNGGTLNQNGGSVLHNSSPSDRASDLS